MSKQRANCVGIAIAILLVAAATQNNMDNDCYSGERVATASVMLNEPLQPGETFIKTWSENDGVLELLEKHGIVTRTGQKSKSVWGAPIVKVNMDKANQYAPKMIAGTY
jgi:hypothetical protein